MKKLIFLLVLLQISIFSVFSQDAVAKKEKILLVYETSNDSINPWIALFAGELASRKLEADIFSAEETEKADLSRYGKIIIFGSVMAFTLNEPVRDWLKTKPDLAGKDVFLFVTANQSHLKKYFNQLSKLLTVNHADLIDSVTCATKKMSADEKRSLVSDFIHKIK